MWTMLTFNSYPEPVTVRLPFPIVIRLLEEQAVYAFLD
jgi:hypothetical protein